MTEPGAATAQVMWGKVADASALRSGFHHVPDRLWRDPVAPKFSCSAYPAENRARGDPGSCGPGIDRSFHPDRDRNRADMLSFADQVRNDPVLLADLEIMRFKRDQFGASQATSNQDRKNCPVTLGSEAL